MNNLNCIAKQFVICIVIVFFTVTNILAAVHDSYYDVRVSKEELVQRLDNIPAEVSMRYTAEVHDIVDTYIRSYRKGSERILGRTNVFFPIFDYELNKNHDLPIEIRNLAIIESGLDVQAVSKVGAVGLWQFMEATAKYQGLSVNKSVDERRDPYLSTKAAYKYLRYLNKEFGDWTLALAAYNCGPGNIKKAIRKSQSTDFWVLEKYLPKETRRYIPKFIAASYLMNYYGFHDLKPNVNSPKFERTAIARITDYTTFADISYLTGVKVSTIKELNPAFNGNYIPRSQKGYLLTLPEAEMFQYLTNADKMDNLEFTLSNPSESFERTIITSGFQLRKAELEALNKMPTLLSVHKNPLQENVPTNNIVIQSNQNDTDKTEYIYHHLQFGEVINDLVGRHSNTTLEEIIDLNEIDLNNPPKPGDLIKIKK